MADPYATLSHAPTRRFFGNEGMARPEGFEPPTPRFVVWCSIQLSYGRLKRRHIRRSAGVGNSLAGQCFEQSAVHRRKEQTGGLFGSKPTPTLAFEGLRFAMPE